MKKIVFSHWKIWLSIPFWLGLIFLFLFALEWKETLRINRIIINGAYILRADEIYSIANIPLKAYLYEVNIFEIQQRIANHPYIKSVIVNRQIPDQVRIAIVERRPIASLSGNQLHYIDEDGVLLPLIQSPLQFDLPMISVPDTPAQMEYGKKLQSGKLSNAIDLLKTALAIDSSIYHMISEVKIDPGNDIILYSTDSAVPIFLGNGNTEDKLLKLKTFWDNFVKTSEAEKLQYIDLRYKDQVIVKWNYQAEEQSTKVLL